MRKFNVKKKDGEKLTVNADSVTFKDGSLYMYKNEPCAGLASGLVRGELAGIISDVVEFYEISSATNYEIVFCNRCGAAYKTQLNLGSRCSCGGHIYNTLEDCLEEK